MRATAIFEFFVADPRGNTSEKLERTAVAFEEGFGAFSRKRLDEDRVGIRQCHHEQRDLGLLAIQPDIGKTEIDLSFSRRMRERQEHFAGLLFPGSYDMADNRHTACVAMFVFQPLKDFLDRMLLLAMHLLVALEDFVNDRSERINL